MTPVLEIKDLEVVFPTGQTSFHAVQRVSLQVQAGEIVGLVGESGSGKSQLALACLGLNPAKATVSGSIQIDGEEVVGRAEQRGAGVALVPQNPMTALSPFFRIEKQLTDLAGDRIGSTNQERHEALVESLGKVGLRQPDVILRKYPHQLSGGQLQRVMVGLAVACQPRVLIADEATTALDTTTQAGIVRLLQSMAKTEGFALIFITHDLDLVASFAHTLYVMQTGQIVEHGSSSKVVSAPEHPYTRALLEACPKWDGTDRPSGTDENSETESVLEVQNLRVTYGRGRRRFDALKGVNLSIGRNELVAVVGRSGSGKSTVARTLLRLIQPSAGTLLVEGMDVTLHDRATARETRRKIGVVFQNPYSSLNPRMKIRDIVAEPLQVLEPTSRKGTEQRVIEALENVGLDPTLRTRFPVALSGGQRQRIAIARAIVARPAILVLDEPTAALDVRSQEIVLNLLDRIRAESGLSVLFITHNLPLAAARSHKIAVIKDGELVDYGTPTEVFQNPTHDHTRELIAAIPRGIHQNGTATESKTQEAQP